MKHRIIVAILAVTVAVIAALIPAPRQLKAASPYDLKSFPGVLCQLQPIPMVTGNAGDTIEPWQDPNSGDTWSSNLAADEPSFTDQDSVRVYCPILRDNVTSSSALVAVHVNVYDKSTARGVDCSVWQSAVNPRDPATPTRTSSVVSSGASYTGAKSLAILNAPAAYANGAATLVCDVPIHGLMNGVRVGPGGTVFNYYWVETSLSPDGN